jgi:chromosome partitioning protein
MNGNNTAPWDDYDALRDFDLEVPADETLRAVAFVDKGGTSKTTSLAHMAVVANNELGLDTLLVALDGKQNDLATHFGLDGGPKGDEDTPDESELEDALKWPTIAQAFAPNWAEIDERLREESDDERGALAELIVETGEGPDLIPASEELDGVDSSLGNIDDTAARYSILDEFLTEYVDPHYDLILIDVPGSTSNVATNALWATKHVITPVRPSPLDTKQAEKIRREIDDKIERHDELSNLELTMVMLSQVDSRTKAGEYFMSRFREEFPVELAPKPIQSTQAMVNAQLERETLFEHETDSSTADDAREQYRQNTAELIRRLATPDWKEHADDVLEDEVTA